MSKSKSKFDILTLVHHDVGKWDYACGEARYEVGRRLDSSEGLRKFDGPYVSYYANGNICIETNFINGILNGYTKIYYENGQIELKGFIYTWDTKTSLIIIYQEDLPLIGPDPLFNLKGNLESFSEDGQLDQEYYGNDCDIFNSFEITNIGKGKISTHMSWFGNKVSPSKFSKKFKVEIKTITSGKFPCSNRDQIIAYISGERKDVIAMLKDPDILKMSNAYKFEYLLNCDH